ncbi:GntR family transcriptional regulator [Sphingobium yanoikuyae]|uniref:GntR family transcriptional regulator n=1 Tax=Sphingobium yanoikuyae TaxID=13690 RepID=UPI0026EC2727|nr:GntR family transcriptional regulator [Sphingobium yanoikuyae]
MSLMQQNDLTEPAAGKRQIVRHTADALRRRILAAPAGEQIGSLQTLARELEVGIVTVQQAARVLEHEGLLEVRRGPGGGYYGRRPQMADLERMLGAYLCGEPGSWREILDITSLLFNRLCAAAARCNDAPLHRELQILRQKIEQCADLECLGRLEERLQDILFQMVSQPLFELLTRVALGSARDVERDGASLHVLDLTVWRNGRLRIIDAIACRDPALAHFEADRQNRQVLSAICGFERV